jgi:hypothetical protein
MRPTARLIRTSANPEHGTFGSFELLKTPVCVTLEPYHRQNEKNISCIPAGDYVCKKVNSPKYGPTYEITDIEGRSHVLFHWGNFDTNTRGCVLLGEEFGKIGTDTAILSSKRAFREFMDLLHGFDEFTLTIVECF